MIIIYPTNILYITQCVDTKYYIVTPSTTLPINLDIDKYLWCEYCIRSELKYKSHENLACVFLMWIILPMEMDSNFKKKMSKGQ